MQNAPIPRPLSAARWQPRMHALSFPCPAHTLLLWRLSCHRPPGQQVDCPRKSQPAKQRAPPVARLLRVQRTQAGVQAVRHVAWPPSHGSCPSDKRYGVAAGPMATAGRSALRCSPLYCPPLPPRPAALPAWLLQVAHPPRSARGASARDRPIVLRPCPAPRQRHWTRAA